MIKKTRQKRHKRAQRARAKIYGTGARPRLSVFRSNKFIYGQVIDDQKGKTIFAVSDKEIEGDREKKLSKIEKARKVGLLLAQKAAKFKIKTIIFDRNGYRYEGRVRALAESARKGGLNF